ncbi:hypothetical protein Cch01nite_29810 [Cellulomonas chitinilytica]|uniref:Uncharacterized protein n=1 Tax=Cellulomonas chitinilytica TaxID=398759 RepID=A0A919P2S3_9CELL|nr:hypothetical protein Cch01nite_29810 [Cellulomonas chitinilytica]
MTALAAAADPRDASSGAFVDGFAWRGRVVRADMRTAFLSGAAERGLAPRPSTGAPASRALAGVTRRAFGWFWRARHTVPTGAFVG